MDLLREYADRHSESAFAALVSRHVNLVYAAALRKTGSPDAAEEITQGVFIILAQKAGRIAPKTILPGWLYQTARLTACSFLKSEARRARREQEAYMQTEPGTTALDETWTQLAPLLEDAMGQLGEKERDMVVLRFFGNKSFPKMATASGLSENAAQKRVHGALEKLHRYFAKRGVSSTTAIIAGAFGANSAQAAPIGLAKSVAAIAITKGAAAGTSTLTLIKGALKLMAWTKAKMAIVSGAAVLLTVGTTTITVKEIQAHKTYPWQVGSLSWEEFLKTPLQVRILSTKFPNDLGAGGQESSDEGKESKFIGIKATFPTIIQTAFQVKYSDRIVYQAELPQGEYDFIANLPHGSPAALQEEIKNKFGLVGTFETVETNVFLLKVKSPNPSGLRPSTTTPGSTRTWPSKILCDGGAISALAMQLEIGPLKIPVIDQIGLKGTFDFDLEWDERSNPDSLKQALLAQLGLELVPSHAPIEMLVVEKEK